MIRSKKKVTDFDVNDLTSQTARDVATAGGDSFSESTEPPASAPQSAGDMMYILPVFEDGDKRLANPGDETLGAGDSDWTQPDDLPATDELLDIVPPGGPGDPMEDEVIFFDDGWMGEDFVFYPFDPLPIDETAVSFEDTGATGDPADPIEDEFIFIDDGWMGEDFVFYPFDPLPVDETAVSFEDTGATGDPADPIEDEFIFIDDGWMGEDFVFYPFDPLPVDENGDPIFFHCGVVEGGDVISEQIVTGDEFGAQHTGGAEIAVCDRGAFNGDFVA